MSDIEKILDEDGVVKLVALIKRDTSKTAVTTGDTNGTIKVTTNGNTENVAVKGLGTAAYSNVINNTTKGEVGWNSAGATNANNLRVVNVNTLSYWNGCYNGTNSNLTNCNRGAFGTIVTKNVDDYALVNHTHKVGDVHKFSTGQAGGLDLWTQTFIGSAISNKSFGLPASAITVEYSNDGGETWEDYGLTDKQKMDLFTGTRGTQIRPGKKTETGTQTVDDMVRVTIIPTDRYVTFMGVYNWVSTQGNTCTMDLEFSTIGSKETFTYLLQDKSLQGWSGHNIYYWSGDKAFGGGSNQTSNGYAYRITYKMTAVTANYSSPQIMDIRFVGLNVYTAPSGGAGQMVLNNRLYAIDNSFNATFPAMVTATGGFTGNLTGTATTATEATSVSIAQATANADRYVWFSDSSNNKKPVYDTAFKYNPSTDNLTVGKINGMAVSSFVQESDLSAHEKNNPRNIEYIVGTQTASTNKFTGVTQDDSLYDGKCINYKLPFAGTSTAATLNLTLAGGTTTGEIPVYISNATRLTTHKSAGQIIMMTYNATNNAWQCDDYWSDGNTYDRTLLNDVRVTAGTNKIMNYSLIMQKADGTWESFTTTSGTGTTKTKNTSGFRLGKIWVFNYNGTIAAGALTANDYLYDCMPHTLTYSTNCGTTLVANKPVYLVGTIGNDGLFYLDTPWWTQTEPTTEDGKVYIYLGNAYSTSAIYKVANNPIYEFKNGAFGLYSSNSIQSISNSEIDSIINGGE